MGDVPSIDGPEVRLGAAGRLRGMLDRIERWASRSDEPSQDPERADVDCSAAECFWGDPRMQPSSRRR